MLYVFFMRHNNSKLVIDIYNISWVINYNTKKAIIDINEIRISSARHAPLGSLSFLGVDINHLVRQALVSEISLI